MPWTNLYPNRTTSCLYRTVCNFKIAHEISHTTEQEPQSLIGQMIRVAIAKFIWDNTLQVETQRFRVKKNCNLVHRYMFKQLQLSTHSTITHLCKVLSHPSVHLSNPFSCSGGHSQLLVQSLVQSRSLSHLLAQCNANYFLRYTVLDQYCHQPDEI